MLRAHKIRLYPNDKQVTYFAKACGTARFAYNWGLEECMIAQQNYSAAMKRYESALDDSYRADNGVFYTDVALAEKIIASLRIPKEASILDPCCGTGSFLYAASKKGYRNIFGVDCDNEAVALCAKYVPTARLMTADTIGNADVFEEQVDYVIGNPPYAPIGNGVEIKGDTTFRNKVAKYGKNLFVAALELAYILARHSIFRLRLSSPNITTCEVVKRLIGCCQARIYASSATS